VNNVKIHLDTVGALGHFIEVEAIDKDGKNDLQKLKQQCEYYVELFGILPEDFIAESYSDLLLKKLENGSLFPHN
jgi:adenylate cyclase class IV